MPFAHGVEEVDVVGRGRQHDDEVVQARKVQLADGAGVALLDQEAPAALRTQAAHDVELGLRQPKTFTCQSVAIFLLL